VKSYQEFFAELKRRKVFRVAAVYGATAFVLLQVADLLKDSLTLPESFMPFILAVTMIGFPIALVLAWAFEMTPDGMLRTSAPAAGEIEGIISAPLSQRWPAGLMALAGMIAMLAGAWWVGRQGAPDAAAGAEDVSGDVRLAMSDLAEDDRPSIAVLPFADMSPEQDQEYFVDGMTEEIFITLGKIRDLRVSGRTSAFAYKGEDKDLRDIGDELSVRYLVEGSVRKAGNELRITAQLIDAADGTHLWSDAYDRTLDDVFAIQTEIAEAIAEELRVPLGLDDGQSLVTPTADVEAYDLYLAGRARMRERGALLAEAIELFEAAIAHDSMWAPAWAGLAEATEISVWYPSSYPEGSSASEYIHIAVAKAERAARRALELDPDNASALVALGSVHRDRAEWEESETTYLRAIALDPDNAEAHQQYGELLLNIGRVAEAVRATDRAAVLDPAGIRFGMLSTALEMDDRLDEALEAERRAALISNSRRTARLSARRFMTAGLWEQAIDIVDKWNQAHPDREDLFIGDRSQIADVVAGLRQGTLARPAEDFVALPTQWIMLGQPDSAVAALLADAGEVPFGRTLEVWRRGNEPILSDPRVEAFFAERGLAGMQLQRTPVSERTRPLALRESNE